jgi:uncharacterized phage protein (TIGR01671 family)
MREHKYKIWDKKDTVMLDGAFNSDSYEGGMLALCIDGGILTVYQEGWEWEDKNRYELIEYTGLKDKNGKEIYEGDICKQHYTPLGCASWDRWYHYVEISMDTTKGIGHKIIFEGRYQVGLPERLKGNKFSDDSYHRPIHRLSSLKDKIIYSSIGVGGKNWEIIGNIYENPELTTEDTPND